MSHWHLKKFFFQEHLSLFVNPYRLLILYTCTFKFLVHLGAFSFFLLPVLLRNNQHIALFRFGASRVTQMIKNLHVIKPGFDPWVGKIPWRSTWQSTPVFLPGESHRERSLVGCSPQHHRVGHNWSDLAHSTHLKVNIYPIIIWCTYNMKWLL